RQAEPAPRATEVKTVEVRDLAVGAVADDGRLEQGRRLALGHPWQELLEPDRKQRRVRARHAPGFDQRRRQELVAAWLPRLAIAIGTKPVARPVADQAGQWRIELFRPLERQDQREGGVKVSPDADRVGQDREIVAQTVR